MSSIKGAYHPNAYVQNVKNVKAGLVARTKILNAIDKQPVSAPAISISIVMSYAGVMYHLHLLEKEETLCRKGRRPCIWILTGLGQKRLLG